MSGMNGFWAASLKVLISLVGFALLVVFGTAVLPWLRRLFAPDPKREHIVKLRNRSNFPCSFEIEFESEADDLQGAFYFKGSPLPKAKTAVRPMIQPNAPHQAGIQGPSTKTSSGPDLSKAKGKLTLLSPIISILGSVGGLIPGSIGASMKEAANNMRKSQMDARIALDAPEMAKKRVNAISTQSARVMGTNEPSSEVVETKIDVVRDRSPQEEIQGEKISPEMSGGSEERFITKSIAEGEKIELDLRLRWNKYEHLSFSKVYCLKVSQRPTGEQSLGTPTTEEHEAFVTFPAGKMWGYVGARVSQTLFVLLTLALGATLMIWVWIG